MPCVFIAESIDAYSVLREIVRELLIPSGGLRLVQSAGHVGGVLEPLEREEVVPVRMHRLGGVAFVADRLGHQAIKGVQS